MKIRLAVPILLLAALLSQACSTQQITLALDTAALAAEMALSTTSPPVPGSAEAIAYTREAADAISQVGTVYASPGTNASKAAQTSAILAGIVARDPHLPAGTPQRVISAVSTLAQSLTSVLATYGQPPVASPNVRGLLAAVRPPPVSSDDVDRARGTFKNIAARAKRTSAHAAASTGAS